MKKSKSTETVLERAKRIQEEKGQELLRLLNSLKLTNIGGLSGALKDMFQACTDVGRAEAADHIEQERQRAVENLVRKPDLKDPQPRTLGGDLSEFRDEQIAQVKSLLSQWAEEDAVEAQKRLEAEEAKARQIPVVQGTPELELPELLN